MFPRSMIAMKLHNYTLGSTIDLIDSTQQYVILNGVSDVVVKCTVDCHIK